MTRFRWMLAGGILIASSILAFVLRDITYHLIVVPLSYVLWLMEVYYSAVPQFLLWVLLIVFLLVGIAWNLIPDVASSPRRRIQLPLKEGQVESLAIWIHRIKNSNYFKWQLANRLGRLARRMAESSLASEDSLTTTESIQRYLAAGLNQSFVDFPGPHNRFQRRKPTPLDLDPNEVVDHLEAYLELSRDRRS